MYGKDADLLEFILSITEDIGCEDLYHSTLQRFAVEVMDDPCAQWFLQRRQIAYHKPDERRYQLVKDRARPYLSGISPASPAKPVIDLEQAVVYIKGQHRNLTAAEVRILEHMSAKPGMIISRDVLSDLISKDDTGSVWIDPKHHMRNLRAKLGDNLSDPFIIINRRGMGYLLKEDTVMVV